MVTHTNFLVGTGFGLKLVSCLFISRETVILNESEIWSGTECNLDYNQSETAAVLMLLLFFRVLLLSCLCVRSQAWEKNQLVRNGQVKERQEFFPLIGMKCLIDIGGKHPRWVFSVVL